VGAGGGARHAGGGAPGAPGRWRPWSRARSTSSGPRGNRQGRELREPRGSLPGSTAASAYRAAVQHQPAAHSSPPSLPTLHATLKVELVGRRRYQTRAEARASIFAWIAWYNRRLHSTNGYLSPVEWERRHATLNHHRPHGPHNPGVRRAGGSPPRRCLVGGEGGVHGRADPGGAQVAAGGVVVGRGVVDSGVNDPGRSLVFVGQGAVEGDDVERIGEIGP
jgi:hypothetical protein